MHEAIGVDRLSVSFPVDNHVADGGWDSIGLTPRDGRVKRGAHVREDPADKGAPMAFVGVQDIDLPDGSRQTFGKVEFNPSRYVDPAGFGLCPVGDLHDVLDQVLEVVTANLVTPAVPRDEFKVRRLDVARDFDGVADVPGLLHGLASVHRPWSRRNDLFNDGTKNGAQTLMVGSKAGVVRLYDKHDETKGRAPMGTLRWETEARKAWAQQYGHAETVADLSADNVHALAADRWDWSGMGVEVCTRNEVVGRVLVAGLPAQTAQAFLGWLMVTAAGHDAGLHRNTEAKYRRLARDLGVALGPETLAGSVVGRLDWDEGTVVLRAA